MTSHQNNFRFLALYMDMRCFESVISKVENNMSSYMRMSSNVPTGFKQKTDDQVYYNQ